MLTVAIHKEKKSETICRLTQTRLNRCALAQILRVTNDFSPSLASDLRGLIRRVVIDHDDMIEVLENAAHHRSDKPLLTESRDDCAYVFPGRLNHAARQLASTPSSHRMVISRVIGTSD